jgi:hypothetical protein
MGVLANFKIRTKVLVALLPLAVMVVLAALYASIQIKSIDSAYSSLIDNETKSYLLSEADARSITDQPVRAVSLQGDR